MDIPIPTSESNGAQGTISDDQFAQRLNELVEKWADHRRVDLELRYQTGQLLNERYGSPDKRQNRGKGILERVAEQLGVAVSELSRMRSFAYNFKTSQDLENRFPEVKTWTAVKELLPKLRQPLEPKEYPSGNGTHKQPKRVGRKTSRMKKLRRFLRTLSSSLPKTDNGLSGDERRELVERFKELAEAVEDCLKIRVSVNDAPAEVTPTDAPEPQAA